MTEFVFTIDAFTPDTIPMARLADYMAELAKLLGEQESVHFQGVKAGSLHVVARVEDEAQAIVMDRLVGGATALADPELRRIIDRINSMLAADSTSAELFGYATGNADGTLIIEFAGDKQPAEIDFGPIRQDGVLEGKIIRVGGRDDSKHVQLQDGARFYSNCVANTDIAQALGHYLFGPTIRLIGQGTWQRQDGEWELKSFRIQSFEVLDETPLDDLVTKLRAVPGNRWNEVDDPVATVLDERGQGDTH